MILLKRGFQKVYDKTTGVKTIFFTVVFIFFLSIVLPFVSNFTANVIGVSESIDTNFKFNIEYIYNIVSSYQMEGRRFYILMRWTFDIVWPIVYTLFFLTTITYLTKNIGRKYSVKLLYIPCLAVMFDLLENITATIVMSIYPIQFDVFVYLLIISSILKWVFVGISFIIVVSLFFQFLISTLLKVK